MEESDLYSEMVELIEPSEIKSGGLDQYSVINEALSYLATLERYIIVKDQLADLGVQYDGRVLLIGPPGTDFAGFTAKVAGDIGYKIVRIRLNQALGDESRRLEAIRLMAEMAQRNAPCVIYLERIDILAPAASQAGALLANELHRVSWGSNGIIVIATTLHPERMDGELLELFDRAIINEGTTLEDRTRVFEAVLKEREQIPITTLAELTDGWSFAKVVSLATGLLIEVPENAPKLTLETLEDAISKLKIVPMGRASTIAAITSKIHGTQAGLAEKIDQQYPEEFIDQLYLEAVGENYSRTQQVIEALNTSMPLSGEDIAFLTRFPFLLQGTGEERTMRLIKAKRTIDRLNRIMGRV